MIRATRRFALDLLTTAAVVAGAAILAAAPLYLLLGPLPSAARGWLTAAGAAVASLAVVTAVTRGRPRAPVSLPLALGFEAGFVLGLAAYAAVLHLAEARWLAFGAILLGALSAICRGPRRWPELAAACVVGTLLYPTLTLLWLTFVHDWP